MAHDDVTVYACASREARAREAGYVARIELGGRGSEIQVRFSES
jgi:hypothetical protein